MLPAILCALDPFISIVPLLASNVPELMILPAICNFVPFKVNVADVPIVKFFTVPEPEFNWG